jgi:hypothetical protein
MWGTESFEESGERNGGKGIGGLFLGWDMS